MFLSATVRASSCKSCFVSLSNDLVQRLATSIKGPAKVFQIEWDGGQAYCSWSGETAVTRSSGFLQSSVVEMGRKFADLNGIRIGEQVVLTPLDNIPTCTRVHVDPLSADDWEIVELHAGFIESNLLNQVRVVWPNQVVPVWINDTVFVSIRIGEIEPEAPCVLLQEFTEVVIAPKQRQQPSSTTRQQPNHGLQEMQSDNIATTTVNENVSSFYRIWRYLFAGEEQSNSERTTQTLSKKSIDIHDSESLSSQFNCCKSLFAEIQINICLRTHSDLITWNENHHEDLYSQQLSCIFVNPDSVGWNLLQCNRPHKCLNDFNGWCKMVTIRKLLSPKEKSELLNIEKRKSSKESDKMSNNSTYKLDPHLKPVTVRMILSSQVLPGNVVLPKQLQKQLGAGAISCFQVAETKQTPQEIKGIILHLEASQKDDVGSSQDIINSFHNWIAMTTSEECPLIIWNDMTMSINTNRDTCLELIVGVLSHVEDNKDLDSIPYYYITASILQHITVVVGDQKSLPKTPALLCQMQADNTVQLSCSIHDLGGFTEVFNKCLNHMLICLDKSPSHVSLTKGLSNGAVLIHGSGLHAGQGCGKTSLGHALCKELQQCPTGAHVIYIDCITLRAKRVETIQRQWQQAFLEAAWYQPSVILLDNLDHVITAPSLTQEMGGEGLYRLRLVQVFKDLISAEIVNKSKIVVIATSRSQDSLHSTIQSGHGVHVFQCCVELGPLNQCQRHQVLSKLIVKKCPAIHHDELETIVSSTARKCEGFSPKDLSALVDRALHFALVRRIDGNQDSIGSLLLDDFSQALTGFSPASLRGVQLHKPSKHTWLDVGGLHGVKKALEETLLWPTKYTGLFSRCPLRLRSGLLLYGPPGSGKTLLAGVIANESGLNFISIKGPELLSKYIGASEQAVRDVFSRAQTARPCILFFDEFDALAPRRGHDSTGVTDRVVNQLLTQLDGVEGLEGVFILAATSRPGLIDPALLRPGRLDKCVYCPMPNQSDRLEILQALTRNISLGDDVNLQSIAERCEEFTGADLKALLYNAQLECIHRKTSKLKLYGGVLDDGSDMRKAENIQMQSEDCVITICQSDLDKAVLTMRPSVSPNERLMYESTFDSFTRSRGNSFTKNTSLKGRATLA